MEVYINPRINQDVYLKNPMDSDLGKKIILAAVDMIDELGFEKFTFKKLGQKINSTEASIYRYFKNKHSMLVYLSAWYWEFLLYHIQVHTKAIEDPRNKLKTAISNLVRIPAAAHSQSILDMHKLQRIVNEQFYKIIRTKSISEQNASGYFESYKKLCSAMASMFNNIDSSFKYPMTMATAVVEMSINNNYCCNHLPSLTEIKCGSNQKDQIEMMIQYFCERLLEKCEMTTM